MADRMLAKSFLDAGEDYERFRPGFPDAAADAVIPTPVRTALDLGAGTGKFTELLLDRAEHVIAVEPSEPMLAVLRTKLPDVEVHLGTAESIPAADGSVDVVTAAQAFHWFDREPACAEIRRVLARGGHPRTAVEPFRCRLYLGPRLHARRAPRAGERTDRISGEHRAPDRVRAAPVRAGALARADRTG
ncbi:class I SAM-dependent methyltransferase [Microbacterium suwonense]|uniref:Methyltransferase type 11 domain-containing protein n=1 Tax=Microbacterium suwonense TaxID=683047 RepID=A0ABM8FSG1_9MICO|nr:class I SAM-dependent methyltransferase [Microbacterium suwonense]BDZ38431.1 hypothetical protein GCM10025863_10450 [Microbacterium suwonense]